MKQISYILCALLVFFPSGVLADSHGAVGSVEKVRGEASIHRDGRTIPAAVGLKLMEKDALPTGSGGSVGVLFEDNTVLSLGPDSHVKIDEYVYAPEARDYSMVIELFKGAIAYLSGLSIRRSNETSSPGEENRTPTPPNSVPDPSLTLSC